MNGGSEHAGMTVRISATERCAANCVQGDEGRRREVEFTRTVERQRFLRTHPAMLVDFSAIDADLVGVARATKNRVSKRLGASSGVIQRENNRRSVCANVYARFLPCLTHRGIASGAMTSSESPAAA